MNTKQSETMPRQEIRKILLAHRGSFGDVAKNAKSNKATVSEVLRGRARGRASQATAARILEAAERKARELSNAA